MKNIFFLCLFLCFKLVRCIILNIHNIVFYSVLDFFRYVKNKSWKRFNYFGIDIFVGMFGKGKTLSLVNRADRLYKKYGDSIKFISNIDLFNIPYIPLVNFNQLVNLSDSDDVVQGYVVVIDEISSVLSHRNYANFPLELLGLLCQQRKCHVYIMCTAQRFFMIDKIFRSIATRVIDCNKIWRFEHCSVYDAWEYENATDTALVRRLLHDWHFVRDYDLNAYDTNQMVTKSMCADFISNEDVAVRKGLDSGIVRPQLKNVVKRPFGRKRK